MTEQDSRTEEFLQHYGVLGMKWGKTRQLATRDDILRARTSVAKETSASNKQINSIYNTARKGRTAVDHVEVKRIKAENLNNPDRVIAARMTRGEKVAALLLTTPAIGSAAIAATSARSRTIERAQETGRYNK